MKAVQTLKTGIKLKFQMQVIRCKPWKAVNHCGPHCQPINTQYNNSEKLQHQELNAYSDGSFVYIQSKITLGKNLGQE